MTLEREPWLTIDFNSSSPFIEVFERIGKPALLSQLIHDPRRPRVSRTRLRGRVAFRIVGDITYGYAWHEQNRTYMLFSHDADGITFAQLARMASALRPLR